MEGLPIGGPFSNSKQIIKSTFLGKNEIMKEKKRKWKKKKENIMKYHCNTSCKGAHIKLIYVLMISTQSKWVLTIP